MSNTITISISGPQGCGKSSLAAELADLCHKHNIDVQVFDPDMDETGNYERERPIGDVLEYLALKNTMIVIETARTK